MEFWGFGFRAERPKEEEEEAERRGACENEEMQSVCELM